MREGDELGAGSGLTREERRRDPSRVLALTDGVYAIIITLLARAATADHGRDGGGEPDPGPAVVRPARSGR